MSGHNTFSRHVPWACAVLAVLLVGSTGVAFAEEGQAPAEAEVAEAEAQAVPEDAADADGDASADVTDSAESTGGQWVSGSFEAGFDADFADGAHDIDLHQWLRLNITPPDHPNLRIKGSLWTTEDVDGDESRSSALYDIDNTYDSDLRARLLSLYLEADDVLGGATLRLGRQRILDGPLYNRVDGLYLKWNQPNWDLYLYGGARASLYEDSHKDLVIGGGVGYRPFDTTRVAIDFFYGDDDRDSDDVVRPRLINRLLGFAYPREVDREIDNTLIALSVNQRIGLNTYVYAQLTLLDDAADEIRLDLNGYVPSWDLTYSLSYRRQLEQIEDRVNDLTGFYRILGPQEEYDHFYLSLHKPLSQKLALTLEGDIHDADNASPITGNRDYVRIGAILSADQVIKNIDASLGVERWDVRDGEDSWVFTGEVVREWKTVEVAVGADFERWRDELMEYNPWPFRISSAATYLIPGLYPRFTPLVYIFDNKRIEVREDIYSLYTKVTWDVKENQRVSGRIVFEDDDSSDSPYWRVQAAYEIDF